MHVRFNRKKNPRLLPSSWVHLCGECNFMAYLSGDPEIDRDAPNVLDM
ncbi:hypothetical protein [Amaricoccus tamworthensis]